MLFSDTALPEIDSSTDEESYSFDKTKQSWQHHRLERDRPAEESEFVYITQPPSSSHQPSTNVLLVNNHKTETKEFDELKNRSLKVSLLNMSNELN